MTTSKILLVIIGIIVASVLLIFFIVRFGSGQPEDLWICENGEWKAHGRPSTPKPETPCGEVAPVVEQDKTLTIRISSDQLKADVKNGFLSGRDDANPEQVWTISVSTSTQIYRHISSTTDEEITFPELSKILNNWVGPAWPISIKGDKTGTTTLEAQEVFYTIQ